MCILGPEPTSGVESFRHLVSGLSREWCERVPRFPRFPRTSLVVGGEPAPIGWNLDGFDSLDIGNRLRWRAGAASPSGGKRPDGLRRVGGSPLVSDQRCKERQRGDATQLTAIITTVHILSSTLVISASFVFVIFCAPATPAARVYRSRDGPQPSSRSVAPRFRRHELRRARR